MEQKSKYEMEIENFRRVFATMKDKKIAIYGIGRRSATLLSGIADYNIVGLLDRDESNIGITLCGIEVVPLDTINEMADAIIINSDPSNYEIIYKRIANVVTIPVYYADGRLAQIAEKTVYYENNEYWNSSYGHLKKRIDAADVVSFDIFDTLIMRQIFSPEDVFRLLGEKITAQWDIKENIARIRANAASQCNAYATIDEIYDEIGKQTSLSKRTIEEIKQLEKDIDLQLCVARQDIKKLYEYCIESGKKVYLISDMYYGKEDIKCILSKCGITLTDDEHIWISCERKKDKISGSMWIEYLNHFEKKISCLHIGDNLKGDIENPIKQGIDACYVMSGKDMFMNSSISELATEINTVSDSVCLGLVVARLFNSPFALCSAKGKVSFEDSETYGYCVYGPLLEKFLIWLYYNSRKDGVDKLLFFARDGYFLEKDYKIVSELLNDGYEQEWCYLPISRRLIYLATMENEDDLKRVVSFPYVGTFAEYMKSRFNVEVTDATANYNDRQINAVGDRKNILQWIEPYKEAISQEARSERKNYINYLKNTGNLKEGNYGTVDLGYYGTNQYYLQRLNQIKTQGYYFYSCLSKDSVYINDISMKGCFQYRDDYMAEKSLANQKNMYIETFLTAPHGMVRFIDENGNVICEPDKKSQKNFGIKKNVNDGVIKFIKGYIAIYKIGGKLNTDNYIQDMVDRRESMEDMLFFNALSGMCDVSENILEGFYFDNDFVSGREVQLEI